MKPAAHLQSCIELLDELNNSSIAADKCLSNYFRHRRYIGSKDKAAIGNFFYRVLRQQISLEYLLEQASVEVSNFFKVALLIHLDNHDIAGLFNGEKFSPTKIPAKELAKLTEVSTQQLSNSPDYVQHNVPEWLFKRLEQSLGKLFLDEMKAINQQASLDLRVNTLKSDRHSLRRKFELDGLEVSDTPISPIGLRFAKRISLFGHNAFKQGLFEVQDEGSQLLALLSNAKEGQTIVDFCAGAGGKTLAMAAMMENKGTLYACDVHTGRLKELSKRAKRAGAHNIRIKQLTSEKDKWIKQHLAMADTVLVDAPCTGTGTWRRKPDARMRLTHKNLTELINIQSSILQHATRLVKPGGQLIYATCSLLHEENEAQVESFLSNHDNFKLCAFELNKDLAGQSDRFRYSSKCIRLLTSVTGTDGFFAARLVRLS